MAGASCWNRIKGIRKLGFLWLYYFIHNITNLFISYLYPISFSQLIETIAFQFSVQKKKWNGLPFSGFLFSYMYYWVVSCNRYDTANFLNYISSGLGNIIHESALPIVWFLQAKCEKNISTSMNSVPSFSHSSLRETCFLHFVFSLKKIFCGYACGYVTDFAIMFAWQFV